MGTKAFYKSKGFYGCLGAILACVADIFQHGLNPTNMTGLVTATFALYGRVVATQPLSTVDVPADPNHEVIG